MPSDRAAVAGAVRIGAVVGLRRGGRRHWRRRLPHEGHREAGSDARARVRLAHDPVAVGIEAVRVAGAGVEEERLGRRLRGEVGAVHVGRAATDGVATDRPPATSARRTRAERNRRTCEWLPPVTPVSGEREIA